MGRGSNKLQEMDVAAQQWEKQMESERFCKKKFL
jgi:hypothetical protein